MKFDPFSWTEVKTNEEIQHPKGRLLLRISQTCPLYITAQGVEALAGVSTEFEVDVSEEVTFRIDAPKAARAFIFEAEPTSIEYDGEVFTNIDRMPSESGSVAEVTRALRMLEFNRRAMLREIREERDSTLEAVRAERMSQASADPVDDPETAPEPESEDVK